MSLKDLPAAMRPREKLLARGAARAGRRRAAGAAAAHRPARHRACCSWRRRCSTLRRPRRPAAAPSADDLKRIKGLGPAKRAELAAVLELARRALAQQLRARAGVRRAAAGQGLPRAAARRAATHEVFAVLFLDAPAPADRAGGDVPRHADADQRLPARGRASARSRSTPRAVILAHNHPSRRGRAVARRRVPDADAEERAALVDVRVLDHLVVGQGTRGLVRRAGAAVKARSRCRTWPRWRELRAALRKRAARRGRSRAERASSAARRAARERDLFAARRRAGARRCRDSGRAAAARGRGRAPQPRQRERDEARGAARGAVRRVRRRIAADHRRRRCRFAAPASAPTW